MDRENIIFEKMNCSLQQKDFEIEPEEEIESEE